MSTPQAAPSPNQGMIDYWNGEIGQHWRREAEGLDHALRDYAEAMIGQAGLKPGETALDVGCGAGASTFLAQEKLADGIATGVDISRPLVTLARERAQARGSKARFEEADASEWRAPSPVDAMISRFGVMFFADPTAAFANIRANVKDTGRLCFICWRDLRENKMMTVPMGALKPFLKEELPRPDPDAPGPGAFADPDKVTRVLTEAGWRDIAIERYDGFVRPPGATLPDRADFLLGLTSVVRNAMADQGIDPAPVREALIRSLETYDDGTEVKLPGAAWLVTAKA